jgi:hypothetical protein
MSYILFNFYIIYYYVPVSYLYLLFLLLLLLLLLKLLLFLFFLFFLLFFSIGFFIDSR